MTLNLDNRYLGLLIGTAIGDSVGLPAEGISRSRNHKLFHGQWEQSLFCGYGMISDDTEHTIFVAQSLIVCGKSPIIFIRRLGWCFRWWFLSLPAGIGLATLKAIIKLWLGFSPRRSGVYSAGNGCAMRSAVIGAYFFDNSELIDQFVRSSTIITHTDKRALIGAKAIAYLTSYIVQNDLHQPPTPSQLKDLLQSVDNIESEWLNIIEQIIDSLEKNLSAQEFAEILGQHKGVSGYVYKTVPIAIYAWYQHFDNFRDGLEAVFNCGGDTDTVGAITGALLGVSLGDEKIPLSWQNQLKDYPRNLQLLRAIAEKLHHNINNNYTPTQAVKYSWWWLIPRNFIFLLIVLMHGFRRLLPPY
jgi:ADP-ribosyl-[dinitrogen reductase] hydrolase